MSASPCWPTQSTPRHYPPCSYESLLDVDFIGKTIWISDKENRSGAASRVVPLPDLALAQIGHVRSHLEALEGLSDIVGEDVVESTRRALGGDGAFLFLISEERSVSLLTPRRLKEKFEGLWPLPLNWAWHWMRTSLANCSVDGELIDSWMGHADFGQEALGRWSGLSLKSLGMIAGTINSTMEEMGFRSASGWARRSR